ncbi:sigma-70 family RNA polymerase sigma factor [Saccharopolyspora erythraea]|nr:sigma-70 family RNA polymerase sigma factor [Saccharopolyspora erythraea]
MQGPSDAELIEAVRHGSTDAYGELYQRHVTAAYKMARQVTRSAAETDDLVSEAFAKVLDTLRAGRGPTTAFRAYLLTAVRNTAYDRGRRDKRLHLAPDVTEVSGADVGVPFTDTAVDGLERTLAAQAFSRLPERWQTVLWHVEIEGQSPSEVAPLLGLTANGVSALAYRAREGLRQAYLQVHLGQLESVPGVEHCRATMDRLGAWTRRGLSKRETAQVETHLDGCDRCRALAAELAEVNGALHAIIGPLVLGIGATGYLAVSGGAGAGTAAAATSGAAGAAGAAPRQAVTTTASGAALVAAVALGLTAGTEAPRPLAADPPPVPAPAQPPPRPPQPPRPKPSTPQPRTPQPTPSPAPAPPPAEANLGATGPTAPIQLVAGGEAVSLPITIRNTGSGPSEPVFTALALPPGVSATVPGAATSGPLPLAAPGPASTTPQSAAKTAAPVPQGPPLRCGESAGGIACTTDRGLAPGETMVINFMLRADSTATGGDVNARVSAGQSVELRLPAVPVEVRPLRPADGLDVEVSAGDVPWVGSRIEIDVRNTGGGSGRAEAVAELPEGVSATGLPLECQVRSDDERRVRCAAELEPGEEFDGVVWLTAKPLLPWPHEFDPHTGFGYREITVPVTATLGTATDRDTTDVRLWFPWHGSPEPEPGFPPLPGLPPGPEPPPNGTPEPEPTSGPVPTPAPPVPTGAGKPSPTSEAPEPSPADGPQGPACPAPWPLRSPATGCPPPLPLPISVTPPDTGSPGRGWPFG